LAAVLFAGLPILDTTLVVLSRRRRGISILTGGRDHLTHRLLGRFGTPRRVAALLAGAQTVLGACAIVGLYAGHGVILMLTGLAIVQGIFAIVMLESAGWAPPAVTHVETPGVTRAWPRESVRFDASLPPAADSRSRATRGPSAASHTARPVISIAPPLGPAAAVRRATAAGSAP